MDKPRPNLLEQLLELHTEGRPQEGLTLIADLHPADVADVLERLPEEAQADYFGILDKEQGAEVLLELEEAQQAEIISNLESSELAQLLFSMDSDDATDVVAALPTDEAAVVLKAIDKEDQREVRKLLTYPEDSAGGLMQMEVVTVPLEATIQEALNLVREQAREVDDFANVFVLSGGRQVVGFLTLRDLLLAKPGVPVEQVMSPVPVIIRPDDDQEEVARLFQKYDLISAPVVDSRGRLLGRVTVDDVVDVIQEEASEDIYRMAGTDDEELVYGEQIFKISRLRLPWLLINLIGGLIASYFLYIFEVNIKDAIVLITFVPVIIAMGGNVGIQSSTVFVRGLAMGHYSAANLGRVVFREMRVAGVIGVICGTLTGLAAGIWHTKAHLGFIVGLAMIINIALSALVGIMDPAFFSRMKIEPAIASGPLVTTANDIMGILIYFAIAALFLRYLLV
jgi:magnesium transporter